MTLDPQEIGNLVEGYEKEIKSIRGDIFKLCWYMRGGLSYTEGMNLSASERESIGKLIKENLETTKNSGLPHF